MLLLLPLATLPQYKTKALVPCSPPTWSESRSCAGSWCTAAEVGCGSLCS